MSFKLQVVNEVERGDLGIKAAARKYGIQSHSTVSYWLRKYGNFDWKNQTPSNIAKTREQQMDHLQNLGLSIFHNIFTFLNPAIFFTMNKSLLSLFLPAGILDYFDIVDYQTSSTNQELFTKDLTIFLMEKPIVPEEYIDASAKASGFMKAREINDYPIRDKYINNFSLCYFKLGKINFQYTS